MSFFLHSQKSITEEGGKLDIEAIFSFSHRTREHDISLRQALYDVLVKLLEVG